MKKDVWKEAAGLFACLGLGWAMMAAASGDLAASPQASGEMPSRIRTSASADAVIDEVGTRGSLGAPRGAIFGPATPGEGPAPRGGVPGACGSVTECLNADCFNVEPGTAIACAVPPDNTTTFATQYARCFTLPSPMEVFCLDFGVEANDPVLSIDVTIVISQDTNGCPPTAPGGADLSVIDSRVVTVAPNTGPGFVTVNYSPPLVLPAGDVVVELLAPDVSGVQGFFVGSNSLEPSGVTYMSAASCGFSTYKDVVGLGNFDAMNWIVRLDGNPLGVTPGSCCFADGTCQFVLPANCVLLGGTFVGGPTCVPNSCPQIPTNETCQTAIGLSPPATVTGNTTLALPDLLPGTCGTSSNTGAPGVWFAVFGTGNTLTASLCNPGTDFDTQLSIFCGNCACMVCVDGNDNDAACIAGSGFESTVSWCSSLGVTYFMFVHGATSASVGAFELTVIDDGVPCVGAVNCTPPIPSQCVDAMLPGQFDEADPTQANPEVCGGDANGGCDNLLGMQTFTELGTLACATPITLSGTAQFDGLTRDTDWFRLTLATSQVLQLCLTPEFPVEMSLVELDAATGNCLSPMVIRPVNGGQTTVTGGACVQTCLQSDDCLPPGQYALFIAPQFIEGELLCSSICRYANDYFGTLDCLSCIAACCLNNQQCPFPCVELLPAACQALGGIPLGSGTSCAQNACGTPPPPCCEADANQDGVRDGTDIAAFIDHLVNGGPLCGDPVSGGAFCATDLNADGVMDLTDLPLFVDRLLNLGATCPLFCNEDPARCQLPTQTGHGAGAVVCVADDTNPAAGGTGRVAADSFSPVANGSVSQVCWWGGYSDGAAVCIPSSGDAPSLFNITYYDDNAGLPGVQIAQFLGVTPTLQLTGQVLGAALGTLDEIRFTALHAPVPVLAGQCYWVEIQGASGGACFFCWETAPLGDALSVQAAAPPYTLADRNDFDMSFCVDLPVVGGTFCLPTGACCDQNTGACLGDMTEATCLAIPKRTFHAGQSCAAVPPFACPPPFNCGAVAITQNTNPNVVVQGTSVSCTDGNIVQPTNRDNHFARLFATGGLLEVRCVTFGVEFARDSTVAQAGVPVEIRVYEDTNGGAPGDLPAEADLVLLAMTPKSIPGGTANQLLRAEFTTPVDVSLTTFFVVEIFTPDGSNVEPQGTNIVIGANSAGQSAPGYLKAPVCGINTFADIASLCVPCLNTHIIMLVEGN